MKRLTLIRHAQADDAPTGQRDWDRPLTRRGQADAATMAKRMKDQLSNPDSILSSPAVRTRQTAELFTKQFPKISLKIDEELYLASPKQMLSVILAQDNATRHLVLVGHNPGISELADELSQERRIEGMPTASVVTMEFDIDSWQELLPASGTNVEFDYPQRAT